MARPKIKRKKVQKSKLYEDFATELEIAARTVRMFAQYAAVGANLGDDTTTVIHRRGRPPVQTTI